MNPAFHAARQMLICSPAEYICDSKTRRCASDTMLPCIGPLAVVPHFLSVMVHTPLLSMLAACSQEGVHAELPPDQIPTYHIIATRHHSKWIPNALPFWLRTLKPYTSAGWSASTKGLMDAVYWGCCPACSQLHFGCASDWLLQRWPGRSSLGHCLRSMGRLSCHTVVPTKRWQGKTYRFRLTLPLMPHCGGDGDL